jgi:hypothetical protein
MPLISSFFRCAALVVSLLLVGHVRAESNLTSEEMEKLRVKEEKAMAATAHILIIHAQGSRGPLASSTEKWHEIACLNGYAALRQCFPENLRNPTDEEFFEKKIAEDKISRFVAKALEQYGAAPFLQLLEECAGKLQSLTPASER